MTTLYKCDWLHYSGFFFLLETASLARFGIEQVSLLQKLTFLQSDKEMADYTELVREKWQEKISEYLKENAFDRTALDQMIAAIRTGKMMSFHTLA